MSTFDGDLISDIGSFDRHLVRSDLAFHGELVFAIFNCETLTLFKCRIPNGTTFIPTLA